MTNQDTPTAAIAFTVADDGGVDALTVTATSGTQGIVSADGVRSAARAQVERSR